MVGGVGCQTDDSFLLTQHMLNGIPPKPGFSHSVMQTTDSFLLAKSQGRPYVRKGKTAPAPSAPTPMKNSATINVEKAVDAVPPVNGPENNQKTQKIKRLEAPDGVVDNNGAVNEGFVKDEECDHAKQSDEDLRDPKKIVSV